MMCEGWGILLSLILWGRIDIQVDDNGLMALRSRELKLRLLDKSRIRSERTIWQLVNIAGPVLIVILSGLIYGFFRKRMYTRHL
jgi:ABC-2 type transport system permease protein